MAWRDTRKRVHHVRQYMLMTRQEVAMNTSSSGRYAANLLALATLFPLYLHAGTYGAIVAFGDSLTDTGNKYVATGLANTPPYDLLDPFRVPD
jgi:hypothetical protein